MLHVQTFSVGLLQTNCYLVTEEKSHKTFIIDPGDDASYIAEIIVSKHLIPQAILATHGHFDHILAAFELQHIFTIPFYLHARDEFLLKVMRQSAQYYLKYPVVEPPPVPTKELWQQTVLMLGVVRFDIMETPGHTPGGVSFYCKSEEICFTGDTVFAGGAIGDWRHTYSDKQKLLTSVKRIVSLPGNTVLFPGHGEETSIEQLHV